MSDLHQLRVFLLVADKKSFSAAAEVMLLSQPTVSSHIKKLEDQTGLILFNRLPRSVELTPAGKILYRHAKEILALHRRAMEALNGYSGRLCGSLDIGGSTIPGEYILPDFFGAYRRLAPEVIINLHIGDSRAVSSMVLDGTVEMGVVGSAPGNDNLVIIPFLDDELVMIVSKSHKLARKSRPIAAWKDVSGESFWLREPGSGTRQTFLSAVEHAGTPPGSLSVIGTLGSTEAVKRAVATGSGVGIISARALDPHAKNLVSVRLKGLALRRTFVIVHHRYRQFSPPAEAFMKLLRAENI